jgi:putative ABC transport system permease protein
VPGIEELAPYARLPQGDVAFAGRSTAVAVFGVTPSWAPVWDWDAEAGDFLTDEDLAGMARVAVLGPTARRDLFGEANPIGETIQIGTAPFVVKGVMESKGTSPGGGDMDNRVYVPLSTLMRRVANVDYLNGIKVRFRSPDDLGPAVPALRAVLRDQHRLAAGVPDDFAITTPEEITKMAGEVAGTFNILLVLVSGISLLAGGVVVGNIMLMAVKERTREIGLRKAVGARSSDILRHFLLEATAVTAAGGLLGILIGFAGGRLLQWLFGMPAVLSWEAALIGLAFSSVVGLIAGLQPARRAACLPPVDALRG